MPSGPRDGAESVAVGGSRGALDAGQEEEFRRSRNDEESRRATLLAVVVGVAALLFAVTDVRFVGSVGDLRALFGLRVLFASMSVLVVVVARSDRGYRARDRVVLAWAVAFVVLDLFAASTRPSAYVGYVALTPLIVLALYTAVPGPPRPLIALAWVQTAGIFMVMLSSDIGPSTLFTISVALLATHAIGWTSMREVQRSIREEFIALRAEQKAKSRLEKALEEIRTLRGILPICSACKKVRNDDGAWEQVESYVMRNSDAQFSHGLCPTCLDELYGHI